MKTISKFLRIFYAGACRGEFHKMHIHEDELFCFDKCLAPVSYFSVMRIKSGTQGESARELGCF